MKPFGLGALLAVSAGLAAGWSVAFADAVARDAYQAPRLDLASLRGLGHGLFALAGGTASTPRARLRRGFVDTVVSNALLLTLVGDVMRRAPRRPRLAIASGGVAALSVVPFLPQRPVLGAALAFVLGGAAAVVTTRLAGANERRRPVSVTRPESIARSPRDDDPSTSARLAA